MSKALCIISLIVSVLVFLLFVIDMIAQVPFGGTEVCGLVGHVGMLTGAVVIGTFSVLTFMECR